MTYFKNSIIVLISALIPSAFICTDKTLGFALSKIKFKGSQKIYP